MGSVIKNIDTRIESGKVIKMPIDIPDSFIDKILIPYKENVKYLKSAQIVNYYDPADNEKRSGQGSELVTIQGKFSIPESCYIDNTGHFNSVEFNICFNQLAYVLFAKCIKTGILQKLVPYWEEKVNMSFDTFLKYQLSSMLIVKIEGNFLRPINSNDFSAKLTINRILWANETPFIYTKIAFADSGEGRSAGSVLLAFSNANTKH